MSICVHFTHTQPNLAKTKYKNSCTIHILSGVQQRIFRNLSMLSQKGLKELITIVTFMDFNSLFELFIDIFIDYKNGTQFIDISDIAAVS